MIWIVPVNMATRGFIEVSKSLMFHNPPTTGWKCYSYAFDAKNKDERQINWNTNTSIKSFKSVLLHAPISHHIIACSHTNGGCAACCGGGGGGNKTAYRKWAKYLPLDGCLVTCGSPQTYASCFAALERRKKGCWVGIKKDIRSSMCNCHGISSPFPWHPSPFHPQHNMQSIHASVDWAACFSHAQRTSYEMGVCGMCGFCNTVLPWAMRPIERSPFFTLNVLPSGEWRRGTLDLLPLDMNDSWWGLQGVPKNCSPSLVLNGICHGTCISTGSFKVSSLLLPAHWSSHLYMPQYSEHCFAGGIVGEVRCWYHYHCLPLLGKPTGLPGTTHPCRAHLGAQYPISPQTGSQLCHQLFSTGCRTQKATYSCSYVLWKQYWIKVWEAEK